MCTNPPVQRIDTTVNGDKLTAVTGHTNGRPGQYVILGRSSTLRRDEVFEHDMRNRAPVPRPLSVIGYDPDDGLWDETVRGVKREADLRMETDFIEIDVFISGMLDDCWSRISEGYILVIIVSRQNTVV
jgi:hypothetical protein